MNDLQKSYLYQDLGCFSCGVVVGGMTCGHWWFFGGVSVGYLFYRLSRTAQRRHFKKLHASGVSQVTQTGRFFR